MRNEERFVEIYEKYKNLVMKVAAGKVDDYFSAQEICQDTFAKLLVNFDEWKDDELIKGWLIVTASHGAIDYNKKGGSKREYVGLDGVGYTEESTANKLEDEIDMVVSELERTNFRKRLLFELQEVNENWYQLITQICCLGRAQEDVAQELHISPSTLRARLYRAREWIRERYGDEYRQFHR